MGYMAHDAVIVVTGDWAPLPDIDAFRETLPTDLRPLVLGPIATPINNYRMYAFLPDGSKEGWELSDAGDEHRERFKDLFRDTYSDGSCPHDWTHVRFGGSPEDGDPDRVIESNPRSSGGEDDDRLEPIRVHAHVGPQAISAGEASDG